MNPHSLTAVILVAGMVVVGWGIVWHEWWAARRDARRQHPSNFTGITRDRFDHDSQAIDVAKEVEGCIVDFYKYIDGRTPGRH